MGREIDEALVAEIKSRGAQFDFGKIRSAMDESQWEPAEDIVEGVDSGQRARSLWLGTVFGLTPSGKVYAPWTSNASEEEAIADEEWREELERSLEAIGLFLESHDCDFFAYEIEEIEEAVEA